MDFKKREVLELTRTQKKTLDRLQKDILIEDTFAKGEYEYKKWEVSQFEDSKLAFLICEVGRKGDENTLAAVFDRTHRHLVIGPKGGVESFSPKVKGYSKSPDLRETIRRRKK